VSLVRHFLDIDAIDSVIDDIPELLHSVVNCCA